MFPQKYKVRTYNNLYFGMGQSDRMIVFFFIEKILPLLFFSKITHLSGRQAKKHDFYF